MQPEVRAEKKSNDTSPEVAIILCSYNGEKYISDQIASIQNQTFSNWHLYISDDGSTDKTKEIIQKFANSQGDKVTLLTGPGRGFSQNFISVLSFCRDEKYFAFCDQDDYWHPDKLSVSIEKISGSSHLPAMVCGRAHLINEEGRSIGYTPVMKKKPSFRNALVQSIAGGNTMLINQKARETILGANFTQGVPAHDWMTYLVITAVGGSVIYDPNAKIDYRQHNKNIIGARKRLSKIPHRVRNKFAGQFKLWNEQNINILDSISSDITLENQTTLNIFKDSRKGKKLKKLFGIMHSGVHRQSKAETIALVMANLLGLL